MASAIDTTKPATGAATTQSVRDNFAAAKSEIEALQAGTAALSGRIATNETDINAAESAIASNASSIGTTNANVAVLDSRVDAIEATPPGTDTIYHATKAELDADLAHDQGTGAILTNDPTPAFNNPTIWRKVGASGTGSWAQSVDRLSPMQAGIDANTATLVPFTTNIKPTDTTTLPQGTFGTIFKDVGGLVAGGLDSNLDWWFFSKLHTQGGEQIGASTDPNVIFQVNDLNGNVALRISADGHSDFIPGSGGTTAAAPPALGADIVHIILRGQSLWQGAESIPAVSTPALGYGGLMFGGYGVRTWGIDSPLDPTLRPDAKFNLVPLAESDGSGVGETIASGLVAQLKDMIVGHYKTGSRSTGQQILCSFADQGGRLLDEIRKTPTVPDGLGAYYATAIDDVRRAFAAAQFLGKSYAVLLVDFGQGEANGVPQMTRGGPTLPWATFWPQYRDQLLQFRTDMETDIKAITGQAGRIPLVSYLTEGPVTSHAQIMAGDAEPGLVQVVGPHYDTPTALNSHYGSPVVHGNEIHRSADGTRLIGCRHGKWIARQYLHGERIIPHRITGARYIGSNQIIVDLQVPRPPVVIDTTWLPAQTAAMGFSIWSGVGETATLDVAVTKVEVAGPAQLKLTLAGALPASPHLHYARLATTDPIALPLLAYQDGAGTIFGYATKELVFAGLIKSTLQPLVNEGCFYANNTTAPRVMNRALIIRDVQEVAGQTKLIGQINELGVGAAFLPGDIICPMRGDPYGNIRDSDNEYCPLTFSDSAYGTRAGQRYPMWNWLSTDLDVEILL